MSEPLLIETLDDAFKLAGASITIIKPWIYSVGREIRFDRASLKIVNVGGDSAFGQFHVETRSLKLALF